MVLSWRVYPWDFWYALVRWRPRLQVYTKVWINKTLLSMSVWSTHEIFQLRRPYCINGIYLLLTTEPWWQKLPIQSSCVWMISSWIQTPIQRLITAVSSRRMSRTGFEIVKTGGSIRRKSSCNCPSAKLGQCECVCTWWYDFYMHYCTSIQARSNKDSQLRAEGTTRLTEIIKLCLAFWDLQLPESFGKGGCQPLSLHCTCVCQS